MNMSTSLDRAEAICERCGRCCFPKQKIGVANFRVLYDKQCQHIKVNGNTKEHTCRKYIARKGLPMPDGTECNTAIYGFRHGLLPPDCPYIEYYTKKLRQDYICLGVNWRLKDDSEILT